MLWKLKLSLNSSLKVAYLFIIFKHSFSSSPCAGGHFLSGERFESAADHALVVEWLEGALELGESLAVLLLREAPKELDAVVLRRVRHVKNRGNVSALQVLLSDVSAMD